MVIENIKSEKNLILKMSGRLDAITSKNFQEVLMQAFENNEYVQLDMNEITYISSAGLRVLLLGEKRAAKKGGVMTLSGVSKDVRDVLDMTGFTDILNIVD